MPIKKGFPVSERPYDGVPPKPGEALTTPTQTNLEDLLGSHPGETSVGAFQPPAPQVSAEDLPPEPLVRMPAEAFSDLTVPQGAFSDEPPPGWGQGYGNVNGPISNADREAVGTGEGNVNAPDPSPEPSDPVSQARASLLADAARAAGGNAPQPKPAPQVISRAGNRAPDIRQALARAAQLPDSTKWRSRVTIGSAWQFDGQLHLAPDWVDRNWAAWEDGPALNVPDVGIVKKDQWIVVQQVLDDHGGLAYEEIKVYPDGTFRSLFMPETGALHGPGQADGATDQPTAA